MSIVIITALGVTVLAGIYAACQDMYQSADRFYDQQKLFDIRIISTLGLTDDDLEALRGVEGIEQAAGTYSETVRTEVDDVAKDADVSVLNGSGMNLPLLLEGALPAKSGEMAVTRAYLEDTGKALGDSVTIVEDLDDGEDDGTGEDAPQETPAEPALEAEPAEAGIAADTTDGEDDSLDTEVDWDAEVDIEDDSNAPNFPVTTFTITGVVLDPMDISNKGVDFRSAATSDYTFFISPKDADYDVYTAICVRLAGLEGLNCYSTEYEDAVQAVIDSIEAQIMRQREQARYHDVMAEALEKITDAETLMDEKFTDADVQFADAWAELEDGRKELADGEEELIREERDAKKKLADARAELEDGKRQLDDAEKQLEDALTQLQEGQQEYEDGLAEYQAGLAQYNKNKAQIDGLAQGVDGLPTAAAALDGMLATGTDLAGDPTLIAQFTQVTQGIVAVLDGMQQFYTTAGQTDMATMAAGYSAAISGALAGAGMSSDYSIVAQAVAALFAPFDPAPPAPAPQTPYAAMAATMDAAKAQLAEAKKALDDAWRLLEAGRVEMDDGWAQYKAGVAALDEGRIELADGEDELNREEAKALRELADAWHDIAEGKEELADGEAELIENEQKYHDKRGEAEEKLADAYDELDDIDMTEWYVQDRSTLGSYQSLESDMSSIEAVGNAFPVVFLVVAILISLTTMTRMVEEERGLIGTYKALGFPDRTIYFRYLLYAFAACLIGGLLGDFFGFVVLPLILINILQVLYTLPEIALTFDALYGVGGVLLFLVSIVGSTGLTCHKELRQKPAVIMRPKAPRSGSRIALERIGFIWNRLPFLNKVTARNLFRYKKRMFMTILGIMGCTALVLAGFAIRDSVTDLEPKQYEQTYHYDLMTVTDAADNDEWVAQLAEDAAVADYLNLQIGSYKAIGADGTSEGVQLMVVPAGESIEGYISTTSPGGELIHLDDSGIFITQNAAEILGLEVGGSVTLQSLQLARAEAPIAGVVRNYLGNNVFITQALYESLFEPYAPNGVLAHLSPSVADQPAYAESLLQNEEVLTSISIQAQKAEFATNFSLLNSVMVILIVLAAGLAFVVLFTLSNTNISERVRELASIKVLGFFDREVHAYVNKETMILTGIGILAGLPVGRFISGLLTSALKMPSLYFAVYVRPSSYVFAAVLALCFALVVNLLTNRSLDHIDMIEALKSVE